MKLKYDDRQHAYWLDGTRCKSVTAVAKIPDDTFNLEMWGQRQVAIGLAMSPKLTEAIAAHVEDRDKLNELCAEAKAIAGANDASRRGTAAHRITELHDQGKDVIATELATSILASWQEVLDAAGLEVVPEWMERIVVYPEHRVCGKFDRIVRRRSDGRLVIADLKTGERAIKYPHSIAVQMALYANAPLVAGDIPPSGGTTEEFSPLPDELDREVGYIIHIPEMGTASVAEVDIAAGWQIARDVCFPTLRWRKRTDLVRPVAVEPTLVVDPEQRARLQARIDALRAFDPDAIKRLAFAFRDADLPTLKQSDAHTSEQLDTMDRIIRLVEEHYGPFDDPPAPVVERPAATVTPIVTLQRGMADEGDTVSVLGVRGAYVMSDEGCKRWIKTIAEEALQAGVPIHLKDHPTERRVAILDLLLVAWRHEGDDEIMRTVLTHVTGETFAMQQTIPLGACIGALTIDEALHAGVVLEQLADQIITVSFDADGVMVIDAPSPPPAAA